MELDEILQIVKRHLERLSREIVVTECYVFGSTARGDRLTSSDVGIIVVSPQSRDWEPMKGFDWPTELGATSY